MESSIFGEIDYSKCASYFERMLSVDKPPPTSLINSHIMFLYFAIHGLYVLKRSDLIDKEKIKCFVLGLQCSEGGFRPSSFYSNYPTANKYDVPHIVFTYSALNILHYVGGIAQVDKKKCLDSILRCRQEDGSFSTFHDSGEIDVRSVYAALCICKHFNDFTIIDQPKTVSYLNTCYNPDGGYGLTQFRESHSGAIYCALASYSLLNHPIPHQQHTLNFLMNRQTENILNSNVVGVQGRVGKFPDSCYVFWVGASVHILIKQPLLNTKIYNFLKLCFSQNKFSKYPSVQCDPLHTLHSIVGIKLLRNELQNICVVRGIRV